MLLASVPALFAPQSYINPLPRPEGAQVLRETLSPQVPVYLNKPLAVCIRTSGLAVPWEGSPQRKDTLGGSFNTLLHGFPHSIRIIFLGHIARTLNGLLNAV